MKTHITLGLVALAVAVVAVAAVPVQDAKAKTRANGAAAQDAPDMAAMMEAMMKNATPGEPHAELAKVTGTWNTKATSWSPMMPDAPPQTSQGTSRMEMALDGRYLVERYSGNMPDMGPFEGMGILAFNNATGEYEHVWLDNFSTGLAISRGTEVDGVLTLNGSFDGPMGEKVQSKMITRTVSEDERVFEMWVDNQGEEVKSMEIIYTRAAGY